jgi:SAM-dependent methyltransferase
MTAVTNTLTRERLANLSLQDRKTLYLGRTVIPADLFNALIDKIRVLAPNKIVVTNDCLQEGQLQGLTKLCAENRVKAALVDTEGKKLGNIFLDYAAYYSEKREEELQMRETTYIALQQFGDKVPELVFDFGAGEGADTVPLLQKGVKKVVAIDAWEPALEELAVNAKGYEEHYEVERGAFMKFETKEQCDLFVCSFTWPYRAPAEFPEVFEKTTSLVKPGGYIAGHFFGKPEVPEDEMTYHTEAELRELLSKDYEIVSFENKQVPVKGGETAAWGKDLFHVVARKK